MNLILKGSRHCDRKQHGERIEHQDEQGRDKPHHSPAIVRPEQLGEIERRPGLGRNGCRSG
jgi:hypothetical protein